MYFEICRVRVVADVVGNFLRIDGAALHVVRVFEGDERGLRIVINFRTDERLDQFPGEDAVGRGRWTRQASRDRRNRSKFVEIDVRALLADYFARRRRPAFDGEEVAHAAGRYKKRGFLFENFGGAFLQMIDGGVFAVDVVADFGFGHGAAHGGSWFCDGVTAKIDGSHERFSLVSRGFERAKKAFLLRLENCLVASSLLHSLFSAIRMLRLAFSSPRWHSH